jgi:hypothetical protein
VSVHEAESEADRTPKPYTGRRRSRRPRRSWEISLRPPVSETGERAHTATSSPLRSSRTRSGTVGRLVPHRTDGAVVELEVRAEVRAQS